MDLLSGSNTELTGSGRPGMRLHSLTQARFFAALGVVLFHAFIQFRARDSWPGHLSQFGFAGVSFFFVLSGFVLTWSARAGQGPATFYWNRFARIWPIYALTWSAAVLYAAVGSGTVSWKPVVLGYALLQAWHPDYAMSYNFPAWSLSVEAFFYAAFPFLLAALRRLGHRQALGVVGLAYLWMIAGDALVRLTTTGESKDWWLYSFPPYRLGEFVAGMGLAVAVGRGWRPRVPLWAPVTVIAGLAVVNAAVIATGRSIDRDLLVLLVIPATCALVIALVQRDAVQRGRRSTLVLRLGEASYALYISHAIVGFAWNAAKLPLQPPYMAIYVGLSIAAAVALHLAVEKPAERLLRSRRPHLRSGT